MPGFPCCCFGFCEGACSTEPPATLTATIADLNATMNGPYSLSQTVACTWAITFPGPKCGYASLVATLGPGKRLQVKLVGTDPAYHITWAYEPAGRMDCAALSETAAYESSNLLGLCDESTVATSTVLVEA